MPQVLILTATIPSWNIPAFFLTRLYGSSRAVCAGWVWESDALEFKGGLSNSTAVGEAQNRSALVKKKKKKDSDTFVSLKVKCL